MPAAPVPETPTGDTSAPLDVSSLATRWPPMLVDPAFTDAARRLCLPDLDVNRNLPFVLQDRRAADRAMVVFADAKVIAWCEIARMAGAMVPDGGAGTQSRWTGDLGLAVSDGLTINEAAAARDASRWSYALGVVPTGAVAVRAVVGRVAVEAVVGDGLYSMSWPGGLVPTFLAALDADGDVLASIDQETVFQTFGPSCPADAMTCPAAP
jgi:hypothetical protein